VSAPPRSSHSSKVPTSRKLCLIVVDSLRTDMLLRAVADDLAPNFAALLNRGTLIGDCVSAFPSVTPVACSEIATGAGPEHHHISGMNWYHRAERRYVEYGSSWEATRAFGLFRTLYDTIYNMNMAHLSHEVATVFESLGDAGVRTACTPFLIYRGRRRHELGLEGLMRRVAVAADFRHAVWGPDELFYGELYASRKVPCKPTLRPGTRDAYSACVSRELIADDGYDFLLFSLPDNDHHTHTHGVDAMRDSIAHADHCFGELVDAGGGMNAFLDSHAVILMADHAQTDVESELPLAAALGADRHVLAPNSERPELAELAVSPTARAAAVYALGDGPRRERILGSVREKLRELEGVDFVARLETGNGPAPEAIVERDGGELRFQPGSQESDRRGDGWDLDGDLSVLELERRDGSVVSDDYPDGLSRLWSGLRAPHAGDVMVSLRTGYECVDWGGTSHAGGGSHGALLAGDSLGPLVLCGLEPGVADTREQWTLRDVAGLVTDHFGIGDGPELRVAGMAEATR
jgi:hypothetical protein